MPGGRRNPIQMSQIVGAVHNAVNRAKEEAKDAATAFAEGHHVDRHFVDLTIQFIGASGLPKMDVVGTADPYFVAKLDDQLSFVYVGPDVRDAEAGWYLIVPTSCADPRSSRIRCPLSGMSYASVKRMWILEHYKLSGRTFRTVSTETPETSP
ncbi:hypothetical protein BV20DRAFT_976064 [Pilatotrama ljubarskyi]|nr:hypothetical protein BV20DRAFT_976064 [Pilatotrama ljubarskyi]